MKTIDLRVRPIYHCNDDRIRSHGFCCWLAYYIERRLRLALRELLDGHERETAETTRASIVTKALRSDAANQKEQERHMVDGYPVQNFQCLLIDWPTLCQNSRALRVEFRA